MKDSTVKKIEKVINPVRKNPWTLYALILISLSLPFMTLSCEGKKNTYSGLHLVTGTSYDINMQESTMSPSPFIIGSFAVTIIGLIVVLARKNRIYYIVAALTNAVSMTLLVIFKIGVDGAPQNKTAFIKFDIGFVIYFLLNAITFLIMLYLASTEYVETKPNSG